VNRLKCIQSAKMTRWVVGFSLTFPARNGLEVPVQIFGLKWSRFANQTGKETVLIKVFSTDIG